jgi:hypothetical protein
VIDDLPGRCPKASSRRARMHLCKESVQPLLRLGGVGGSIRILRIWGEGVRDTAEEIDMSSDSPCCAAAVPAGGQRLRESLEKSGAPFLAAFSAYSRISSSPWCRTSSGGESGARPEAREA